jgi:phosphoglycerol transferase MdoB-like AlkP superfamily enzyme
MLAVNLLLKATLVLNNIFGTEGFESAPKLLAKVPLFLGWDVAAAALVAGVAALPALGSTRRWPVLTWGSLVLACAALFATISTLVTIILGAPIEKATLDLAFLDQPVQEQGSSLDSSIAAYLQLTTLAPMLLAALLGATCLWWVPRLLTTLGRRLKTALAATAALLAAITILLLPWLINGELAGIRVHTLGLERSPVTVLAGSYLRPLAQRLSQDRPPLDPWRLDQSAAASLAAPAAPPATLRAAPRRSNVIYVSLESISDQYVRTTPSPMPFLASLGHSHPGSAAFAHHYSTWPQTMKAYFTLFCSELPYPDYRTICSLNPTIPCKSISEAFHDAGFFTALITSADTAYDRKLRFFRHRAFDRVWDMRNMPGREEGWWADSWGVDERLTIRNILETAQEHRDGFFIFYEMSTAHHPYNSCREHEQTPLADERQSYLRALGFIDQRLQELVQGLEARDLLKDTLIVFQSDHGEGFGQHPGSKSHGPKVYQENVHVPSAMLGPQFGDTKQVFGLPTSHIDTAPTILGLVGLSVPCTMKGRNLLTDATPRKVFFGGRDPGAQFGVADGDWKFILENGSASLLFDLAQDPAETNDLSRQHPDLVAQYTQAIHEWQRYSRNLIENYARILSESPCRP